MILKTRFKLEKGLHSDAPWSLRMFDREWISGRTIAMGTKKYCRALMATLKRREYLSAISEVREAQRRELREGAE